MTTIVLVRGGLVDVAAFAPDAVNGTSVASGRKIPRDGGIILAVGDGRGAIETIVRADPFVSRGLADHRVVEFRASQRADELPQRIR